MTAQPLGSGHPGGPAERWWLMSLDGRRAIGAGALALMLLTACAGEGAIPEGYEDAPRTEIDLYVHCGVRGLTHDGREYVPVDGPLTDLHTGELEGGLANPPAGWDNPIQTGWVRVDRDHALFTDDQGHVVEFRLRTADDAPLEPCL